jgi:DNA-binding transcriptional ArsR family regulator
MTEGDLKRCEFKAHMFKALAHPMRVFMLERLKERPYCVCELARAAGIDKSVASKHLSQLKEAGLIADEKRGTQVHYRLIAPCILELASCAEGTVLENRKKRLEV